MSVLLEDSKVYTAAQALCEAVLSDEQVQSYKKNIDDFLVNAEARALFECVNKMGEELREKHMGGVEPTEAEIAQFDKLRENVISNSVCNDFLSARQQIDAIFTEVNRFFGMTLEMNKVPTLAEVMEAMQAQASGSCSCGGSCGGNCDDCEKDCDGEGCDGHNN